MLPISHQTPHFDYLKRNNFTTILSSGNITPVLKFYQELLNIDYVLGTNPKILLKINAAIWSIITFSFYKQFLEFPR